MVDESRINIERLIWTHQLAIVLVMTDYNEYSHGFDVRRVGECGSGKPLSTASFPSTAYESVRRRGHHVQVIALIIAQLPGNADQRRAAEMEDRAHTVHRTIG